MLNHVHLQGYHTYMPVVTTAAWQQQHRHQMGKVSSAAAHSDGGSLLAPMRDSIWRNSLLDSMPETLLSSSSRFRQVQGQQSSDAPHTEAFFLSQTGGEAVMAPPAFHTRGGTRLHHQQHDALRQHQQQQQRQWGQFTAPRLGVEEIWKAGRAATTAAVLQSAHLAVHESPADALSLLLTPGLLLQPALSAVSPRPYSSRPASSSSARGRLLSRKGSAIGSRPSSARTGRPTSAVPPLLLHRLGSGPGADSSSGGHAVNSSRPGSAVWTSRLGPGVSQGAAAPWQGTHGTAFQGTPHRAAGLSASRRFREGQE